MRGAEYLGCDNLGLAAQFSDGQRYMLVLIDFLENSNVFGTRILTTSFTPAIRCSWQKQDCNYPTVLRYLTTP